MIPLFGIFRRQPGPLVEPNVLAALARVAGYLYCTAEGTQTQVVQTTATTGWLTTPAGYSVGVVTVRLHVSPDDHDKDSDPAVSARRLAHALGLPEQPPEATDNGERTVHAGWCTEGSSFCPVRIEVVSIPVRQ
jgi:hypothetical protein